ncbi:hypothetical protein BJY01DRAFT_252078 [Aspergillus pseudoustus]|uniref:Amino acid transporter transmembrane domain-containing protein n=1 Tax=Aspergillus pseudoustus TaxID=1810923 RepID=A0ABR4J889_9EURO
MAEHTTSGVEMQAIPDTKVPDSEDPTNAEPQNASITPYPQYAFGNEEHAEVRYKVLTWWYGICPWPSSRFLIPVHHDTINPSITVLTSHVHRQCSILMVADTISLGVLALPAAVANLGLAPALSILLGLGAVATYTGYVIGQLK